MASVGSASTCHTNPKSRSFWKPHQARGAVLHHPLLTYNTDCNDAGCQTTKSPVRSVQELNTDANLTAAISDCLTAPRQICSIWHLLSRHTKLYQQCMHLFVRWATATPSWLEYSNTSWQQTWTDRHDWDPLTPWCLGLPPVPDFPDLCHVVPHLSRTSPRMPNVPDFKACSLLSSSNTAVQSWGHYHWQISSILLQSTNVPGLAAYK